MKAFADLYTALDDTNKTNEKIDALVRYFASAPPADAAWALYFLIGRRPRQAISTPKLRAWAVEAAGLPGWLFDEAYDAVGDFAETAALLLPTNDERRMTNDERQTNDKRTQSSIVNHQSSIAHDLRFWVEERLLPLRDMSEDEQHTAIVQAWDALPTRQERFVWHKLITGGFRVGVSQRLVTRALAQVSGVEDAVVAHRLMGEWTPSDAFYARLLALDTQDADASQPYPFCLAYPLEAALDTLGSVEEWQAEWKWDGIRSQLIRRAGQTFIWSRGEELVTDRYPELAELGALLPDGTAIDGEILPWKDGVLPFAQLQRRIGRKTISKKLLADIPVIIMAYDLLELNGADLREQPLEWRRARLAELVEKVRSQESGVRNQEAEDKQERKQGDKETSSASDAALTLSPLHLVTLSSHTAPLQLSPLAEGETWAQLATTRERSRDLNAEGLMLKRKSSAYRVGRQRGDWWKWKIAPYTIDAVLINAQRGSGKRASLYTDYTFAVWDGDQLVPFAKAYSGLTDVEIRKVDAFVRRNTVDKFGPVRSVTPELVFELAFEGIQRSSRHKSGIAVRFPRILRWRIDKPIREADSLETIQALLPPEE